MGLFDDLIQRGLDEAARRRIEAEEEQARMQAELGDDIMDGEYREIPEEESIDTAKSAGSEDIVSQDDVQTVVPEAETVEQDEPIEEVETEDVEDVPEETSEDTDESVVESDEMKPETESSEEVVTEEGEPVADSEEFVFDGVEEDIVEDDVEEVSEQDVQEEEVSDDVSVETVPDETDDTEKEEQPVVSRQDCVSGDLKFPDDMSEERKDDIRKLMAMPETNENEVSAKAVELLALHRNEPRRWVMEAEGTGPLNRDVSKWTSQMALKQFHQMYDADGGQAWMQNEIDHPLEGWSNPDTLQGEPETVKVDMKQYGCKEPLQTSPELVKEASVQQDVSGKESGDIPEVKSTALAVVEPKYQDGYSELYAGTRELKDDGMIAYDGYLGKFEYDPTEFELQAVRVEPDEFGNGGGTYPVLKYIGNEVDGRHIHIPEGLTCGALMFADNQDLQTMPKLPDSLEDGFAMFKGCTNMEYAKALTLPKNLEEASFMFADCTNMTHGPSMMPSSLKDATGMFYNCQSMENTPKLNSGLEVADSMFAHCKSLTKKPHIPYSVQQAEDATYGCDGIDKAEQMKVDKQQAKAQKKVEKQMNKKTFGDRIGSLFSACMQIHACRRSGCNMLYAMFHTHMMRKHGQWGKDMTAGWSALYRQNKSSFNSLMLNVTRQNVQKRRQRDYERGQKDYEAVMGTTFLGKSASKQDKVMFTSGKRAVDSGYFEKVATSGYPGYKTLQTALREDLDSMSKTIDYRNAAGTMNTNAKTFYAKQLQEMVSNQASYYRGAEAACDQKAQESKSFNKSAAMTGASTVVNSNMKLLADRITEMQSQHQLLNHHQARTICVMMAGTSFGKTEEFKQFQDGLLTSLASRSMSKDQKTDDMMRDRVSRVQQANAADRGKQAEAAFDFASDGSSPEEDVSFGM